MTKKVSSTRNFKVSKTALLGTNKNLLKGQKLLPLCDGKEVQPESNTYTFTFKNDYTEEIASKMRRS